MAKRRKRMGIEPQGNCRSVGTCVVVDLCVLFPQVFGLEVGEKRRKGGIDRGGMHIRTIR